MYETVIWVTRALPVPETWAIDLLFAQMGEPPVRLEDLDRVFELLGQEPKDLVGEGFRW